MVIVYMLIEARHGKTKLVSTGLKKFDEITEIHEIYGRFDIMAKIETETFEKLKEFIQNKIRITEGIRKTEVLVVSDLEAPETEELSKIEDEETSEETEEEFS